MDKILFKYLNEQSISKKMAIEIVRAYKESHPNWDGKLDLSKFKAAIIEKDAFYNLGISSIIFPKNLIFIGEGAFYNNELTDVEFPESLLFIQNYAFSENKLSKLKFPSTLLYIGVSAFSGNKLEGTIKIPNTTIHVARNAFKDNKQVKIEYPKII